MSRDRVKVKLLPNDRKILVEVSQDVQPYLEHAQRVQAEASKVWDRKRWAERLCTIPNVVIEKFLNDHNLNFFDKNDRKKIIKIIMTDPSYKYLRTSRRRAQHVPDSASRKCSWEAVGMLKAAKEHGDKPSLPSPHS